MKSLDILDLDEATINKLSDPGYVRRPHVKFVRKISPVQEALFFAGGEKSAKQIIDWVFKNGGTAEHVVKTGGVFPEFVRIVQTDDFGDVVRSAALPNRWVIYEGQGYYSRVLNTDLEEDYQVLTTDEKDSNV